MTKAAQFRALQSSLSNEVYVREDEHRERRDDMMIQDLLGRVSSIEDTVGDLRTWQAGHDGVCAERYKNLVATQTRLLTLGKWVFVISVIGMLVEAGRVQWPDIIHALLNFH